MAKVTLPEGWPEEKDLPSGRIYMTMDRELRFVGSEVLLFKPGVPVIVRREDQPLATAYGAKPLFQQAATLDVPIPPEKQDPTSADYRGAVRAAAELLLSKNDPEDFGANGKPRMNAWQRELGFKPAMNVRDEVWDVVKLEHVPQ